MTFDHQDNLQKEDGFTLIELLVCLLLLGMMLTLAYGSLNYSARALDRTVHLSSETEEVIRVQDRLRHMLEQAVPAKGSTYGDERSLNFEARLSREGRRATYRLSLYRQHESLMLRWQLIEQMNVQDSISTAGEVELLKGMTSLTFEYADRESYKSKQWQTHWGQNLRPPKYIKITVTADAFWPVMIVESSLTRDVDCIYDPVSRNCRGDMG